MKPLFSTSQVNPANSFNHWRQTIFERIVPVELTNLGDKPFHGTLEGANIGALSVTRISQGAIRTEATPTTIRRHDKHDTLTVGIVLDGVVTSIQNDRESVQGAGEIIVLDRRPTVMATSADSRSLIIEISRAKLEGLLGPARIYSALTIGTNQASTTLVTTFFNELIRIHGNLSPETSDRMASVGSDLLVAAIAERLAQEMPKPLYGTVLLQRARAYVENNLGDPSLDPVRLAAAVGISVRRLQQLFQGKGLHISDWIWRRRLEVSSLRLADPGYAHLQLGTLAYGCGFASQPHFSRRFKAHFGMTPSEYRHASRMRVL